MADQIKADYDIVVVGLGPVGLLTAAVFGSAGLKVLGIEKTDGVHVLPRATALDDENVRTLLNLGLVETFLSKSKPAAPMQIVTEYLHDSSTEPHLLFGSQHPTKGVGRPGSFPDMIPPGNHMAPEECHNGYRPGSYLFYQPEFEDMLKSYLKTLPNVETRFSTECVEIIQNHHSHAEIRVRKSAGRWEKQTGGEWLFVSEESNDSGEPRKINGSIESESLITKFIIGCDGARSFVRSYINPVRDYISLDYDKEWIAIDVMLRNEEEVMGKQISPWSHTLCTSDTQYIVIPCTYCYDTEAKGRHIRFDFEVPQTYSGTKEELQSPENVQKLLSTWLKPDDYDLIRATVYRFHCLVAPKWRDRRVFIAGDACHTMPPFLGQGLNQGVKDVANLWWKIAAAVKGGAHDSLLDSYQQERYGTAMKVVASSMRVGQLMEQLKEQYIIGGNRKCIDFAIQQKKNGMDIRKLYALARSQIDIAKPIYGNRSKLDGRTFPQLVLKSVSQAETFIFDDVFHESPTLCPIVVVLSGILNSLSSCMSSQQKSYLELVGAKTIRIAKTSELEELKRQKVSADIPSNAFYVVKGRHKNILEEYDVILVRRDSIVYGAGKGIKQVDELVDELRYSGW
eukprot:CAMPEP_0184025950 /NCGR_PEP_ID=MMETSP0954-20121128/13176_1 /TAXON_ID=627963 /ORGANISM="Aplanochytrium sp, Strain PBS07" /LENGTH=623 /DNA_ID=CAMNT_0026309953 /DNA_START=560 /DNA_END=2428 /DNA_ORIENTATION=-